MNRRRAGSSALTAWTISLLTSSAASTSTPSANNNPVMYSDPEGTFIWVLITAAAGAVAGFAGRFIGDLVSGEWSTWQEYAGSMIGGAVSGALAATGVGLAAAAVVGSVAGDATTVALNVATGTETRSLAEVGMDMLENAAFSAMFSVGGNVVKSMKPDVLKPLIKETAVTVSAVVSTFTNKIKAVSKRRFIERLSIGALVYWGD